MKIPKQAYTTEFKELAAKRIKDGQSVNMVCKELSLATRPCATGSRRQRKENSAVPEAEW